MVVPILSSPRYESKSEGGSANERHSPVRGSKTEEGSSFFVWLGSLPQRLRQHFFLLTSFSLHHYSEKPVFGWASRPTNPQMSSEAQVGLTSNLIISKSCFRPQSATAIWSREVTYGHRKTICHRYLTIKVHLLKQFLPNLLLDLPEIGCMTNKDRSMNVQNGWKPITIMTLEEQVQPLVCSYSQKLSREFHGDDFIVAHSKLMSSFSKSVFRHILANNTGHTDQKCANIHWGTPVQSFVWGIPNSYLISSPLKLAHGVD